MSETMSPSALKPFGIKRVCTVWNISRATMQRNKVLALRGAAPRKKRGPKICLADAQVLEEIKIMLRNSPFVVEGYRKVWARLRQQSSVFSAPRRILHIMRESDLLAPTRRRASPGPRTHDGTIVTQRPDEMWVIDGTSCMTDQGTATVFDRDFAAGVALRHDHRCQFISHAFQDELRFVGIRSSPSFVRSPEGIRCVERFIRTLKEQLLWLTRFATVDELDVALDDICGRRNRVIALRRSRMPLFDSFCADIRIIYDVRNGLHVDMNLPLAKLSMNARRSIHAATSLVLAAHFYRKRTSSQ